MRSSLPSLRSTVAIKHLHAHLKRTETLLDLLDLYTHHRSTTLVGPTHALDDIISIRITLNQEAAANAYPRHLPHGRRGSPEPNGRAAVARDRSGKTLTNGASQLATNGKNSSSPLSPGESEAGSGRARPGLRDGTVRFMLDVDKAREEKRVVDEYLKVEEEEYEVEVEVKNERRR